MILGLAPMDWITDCACRQITQNIFDKYWNQSEVEFCMWTEFMSANGYIANPAWVIKHLLTIQNHLGPAKGRKIIAQIHWWDEWNLIKTLLDIQKKYSDYFSGVELNTGCPANTVMKCWWWSELLKDKENTIQIIKALSRHSTMPFSIKTRAWLSQEDKSAQTDFIVQASRYCNAISIHGRTVKQWHSNDADREFIHKVKTLINKESINCKIIWNWWIRSYQMGQDMLGTLDGIIIWQAAIGNPRIFTPYTPSNQDRLETILEHLHLMIACEIYLTHTIKLDADKKSKTFDILIMPTQQEIQEIINKFKSSEKWRLELGNLRAINEFKKHLFQYIKWIPDSREFKQKVCTSVNYHELIEWIQEFFILNIHT